MTIYEGLCIYEYVWAGGDVVPAVLPAHKSDEHDTPPGPAAGRSTRPAGRQGAHTAASEGSAS